MATTKNTNEFQERNKPLPRTSFVKRCGKIYDMYVASLENDDLELTVDTIGDTIVDGLGIYYRCFEKYLLDIKKYFKYSEALYEVGVNLENTPNEILYVDMIEMLELIMSDTRNHWISYYIYDLNFGERWEPGMIKNDDEDIRLQTISDLWYLLLREIAATMERQKLQRLSEENKE